MLTAADLLAKKKPVTRTVTLVLDGDLADKWNELNLKIGVLKNAPKIDDVALATAEQELEDLRPAVEDATVKLVLSSIGRKAFQTLVEDYPPTDKQQRDARKEGATLLFNAETFPVALIAASLTEPQMTYDDVQQLFDSENFNDTELTELFSAAMAVNTTSKVIDLKKD
jgi:hypothetical protein